MIAVIETTSGTYEVEMIPSNLGFIARDEVAPHLGYAGFGVLVQEPESQSPKPSAVNFVKEQSGVYYTQPFTFYSTLTSYEYGREKGQFVKSQLAGFYELCKKYGILEICGFDRVLVCPSCNGIPTVRPGCASCGSSNIKPDLLVHHYACGRVDFLHTYTIDRASGSLTCPKCHKEKLLINCDYDVSHGLQRCYDCGWTGNAAKLVGQCLACETRFLIDEAKSIEIVNYHLR